MRHSLFFVAEVRSLGACLKDKARDGMEDCAIGQNEEGKDLEDRREAAMTGERRDIGQEKERNGSNFMLCNMF